MRRLVLIHSALGDSRLWRPLIGPLSERFDVRAPDLPGWGDEPLPTEPFSFVDRIATLLPASVVGNSFGGAVALQTALAHAERVDRLILVASSMIGWEFGPEMQSYFHAEEAALDAGDLDGATELNLEFWVPPEHRELVRPLQRRALELQNVPEEPEVRWPQERPLSALTMPTLIVVGDRDRDDFRAIAEHLHEQIPDSQLEVVPGAGHLVGVEQPEALCRLLLDFLPAESDSNA